MRWEAASGVRETGGTMVMWDPMKLAMNRLPTTFMGLIRMKIIFKVSCTIYVWFFKNYYFFCLLTFFVLKMLVNNFSRDCDALWNCGRSYCKRQFNIKDFTSSYFKKYEINVCVSLIIIVTTFVFAIVTTLSNYKYMYVFKIHIICLILIICCGYV